VIEAALWAARQDWFARARTSNTGPEAPELSEREDRLLGELEIAFCAGAWAACVTLAFALAEGAKRDRDEPDPEFDLLRERRNALAHGDSADLPPDGVLEAQAQAAVRTALKALGEGAWR
jgi:hypothetical protein